MQTLIQKARKGNAAAMTALFDESKSKVMFLCQALLGDKKEAEKAAEAVYKKVWEELVAGTVGEEENFTDFAVRKAALYCKLRMSKKNSKIFRVSADAVSIVSYDIEKMNLGGDWCEVILTNLPALHRFIYVLHGGYHYTEQEIVKFLDINPRLAKEILKEEEANVGRILGIASQKIKINTGTGNQDFREELSRRSLNTEIPATVQSVVENNIKNTCEPLQKKKRKKQMSLICAAAAAVVVIALVVFFVFLRKDGGSGDTAGTEITATHYADIAIQDYGTIRVALDGNTAPQTVENFVSLAESGFYDGLTFHRIIEGFMMQGGDPNGDGTGGSENTITGEFSDNGFDNPLSHTRGAISMARSSDYDSASSQFFIVQEDSLYLDGQYAVFGYVTEGMDIVDAICESANPTDSNGTIPSEEQPVITSITITPAGEEESLADAA